MWAIKTQFKERKSFLISSDSIGVIYSDDYMVKARGNQISFLRLPQGSVRLDLSGEVMDRFGLTTFGYWSWERIADLVPINYDPEYDNL